MLLAIDIYFVAEMTMRARIALMSAALIAAGSMAVGQAPKRLNPMIELMAAKKPVFGLYAPSNRRFAGAAGATGATGAPAPTPKTAAQLAADAMANTQTDFIFDGTMEGGMERA